MKFETENYKFYQHKKCEFFPCHDINDEENFNCLFCYCPLYPLGEKCNGNYIYLENGVKDCSNCLIPHDKNNYDYITSRYSEIIELVKVK